MKKELTVTVDEIISDRKMRDKCVSHYEVLEKVKEVFLIPNTDVSPISEVANFYEVGIDAIQKVYQRNKDEFELDGVTSKRSGDFLGWTKCPSQKVGSTGMLFEDGSIFHIGNAGTKVFPRRAILRVGMLLRDSEVAKEVRTQLLNIEEKATPEVKVSDIEEEQRLQMALGIAMASGNVDALAVASANMMAFKNRHIKQLEDTNSILSPKATYHDEVLNKPGLINTTVIAKDLGIPSAAKLNSVMNMNRIIYKGKNGIWTPYSNYEWLITDGYADYKSYDRENSIPSLKWTELGRKWILDNYSAWCKNISE